MLARILWRLAEWPTALGFYGYVWLLRLTARVTVTGAPSGAAIFVNFHRYQPYLIPFHGERARWMLVSPAPPLTPIARFCRLCGLRLVRGTSGNRGREALEALTAVIARGDSVTIAVDGPAGPAFQAKRGCADLAVMSGAPVIPVNYRVRRGFTIARRWDRMLLPLPFDHITVRLGPALTPATRDPLEFLAAVQHALEAHETS